MKCMRVNIRKASLIMISFLINHIHHSQLSDNHMDLTTKDQSMKNSTNNDSEPFHAKPSDGILHCPTDVECSKLMEIPSCIDCKFDHSCAYGELMNVSCHVHSLLQCKGQRSFERTLLCRYCYQTEPWEHSCDLKADCNSVATPRSNYQTNCTVYDDVLCLGLRTFNKNLRCNWTRGYRWSTALALSITLGGFGADRFYLGHWQEGIGKLFSFGGLGVWTLIDVILISLHYLGPADGSLYIQ